MARNFELKTRSQFLILNQKRERWVAAKHKKSLQARLHQWMGVYWARENCALDEIDDLSLWRQEILDSRREELLAHHIQASRWLMAASDHQERLVLKDLLEVHRRMMGGCPSAGSFRVSDMEPLGEGHEPIDVLLVPRVVENALEWFTSDSFKEMHEVERMALMLIKLTDIHPFEGGNGKTLRLCSNFYLLKGGFPPAVIPVARASQYAIAIQNALRFHTQPLIDLLAEAVLQGLNFCLGDPPPPPGLPVLQ
jgi:fido (protein-threonine AMPylation protein)